MVGPVRWRCGAVVTFSPERPGCDVAISARSADSMLARMRFAVAPARVDRLCTLRCNDGTGRRTPLGSQLFSGPSNVDRASGRMTAEGMLKTPGLPEGVAAR